MSSLFSKNYSTSIRINAPREKVWAVLNDFDNYHNWNTFTSAINTSRKIGAKVRLTVNMKLNQKHIIQTEYLLLFEAPGAMDWGMDWGLLLKARRVQRLRIISPVVTEYFTEDKIWGLLSPLVHKLFGRHIQSGFERMAEELKQYVEKS